MRFDYGYIEDDKKKQTYDLKLLGRLAGYAKPYRWILALTSILILAATAADLVMPYLIKIAIDRYIVVSVQEVVLRPPLEPQMKNLADKTRPLLTPSGKPGLFFLSLEASNKLTAEELQSLEKAGILKPKRLYLTPLRSNPAAQVVERHSDKFIIYPEVAVITPEALKRLGWKDVSELRAGDISGLAKIALICALLLVVGYIFESSQVILLEYAGQKLTHDLRQSLLDHVLKQSPAFHDQTTTGRLVSRLTNDVQNLSEMIKSLAVTFFKDSFTLIGIIVLLIHINLHLALLTFVLLPPVVIITAYFRRLSREVFREIRARIAQINSSFNETIIGIRIVQAFRREAHSREQFEELNQLNYLAGMRQIKVFAIFMPLMELVAAIALGIIIWYGGWSVLKNTMTLGAVVAFIGYIRKFFQPIRELAEKFNILQSAMASLERIFTLMDQESALPQPKTPAPMPVFSGAVEFDRVNFSYQPGMPVLRDLSFRIEPGRTLAVVGATGAGKTSIINLLLRFYDVTSGRILIDGTDIRELPLPDHRARIGLVMQDVFLFAGTVRENIAFSRDHLSQEKIEAAARASGATSFIEALPYGYDQKLGEGGLSLSVGQRQLLAFARTLAQDPGILLLDEATASVDSETERLIEIGLERLTTGRTSIIIAHRLSTIRRADHILVLHKGRVIESGDHDTLLAQRGLYYRLLELQIDQNHMAKTAGP